MENLNIKTIIDYAGKNLYIDTLMYHAIVNNKVYNNTTIILKIFKELYNIDNFADIVKMFVDDDNTIDIKIFYL